MRPVNYEVLNIHITLDNVCHFVQYARSPLEQQMIIIIKNNCKSIELAIKDRKKVDDCAFPLISINLSFRILHRIHTAEQITTG